MDRLTVIEIFNYIKGDLSRFRTENHVDPLIVSNPDFIVKDHILFIMNLFAYLTGFNEMEIKQLLSGAATYLYTLAAYHRVDINEKNFATFLVGAFTLAMKVNEDDPYDCKSMAILAEIPIAGVRRIEYIIMKLTGIFEIPKESDKDDATLAKTRQFPLWFIHSDVFSNIAVFVNPAPIN